jgi:hypothetical protein
MSDSQDSSTAAAGGDPHQSERPLVSVTINANSNNDKDSGKFVTTTSLYVAAAPSDAPTSSPCDGEEQSSKLEGGEGEREAVTQEKQNQTSRVKVVLHNADSDTNDSCSTANPMPNVLPSDML